MKMMTWKTKRAEDREEGGEREKKERHPITTVTKMARATPKLEKKK